jgi:type IV pilus assembly protein PilC
VFPPVYLSLVRAGERSGNMPGVLQMIGDYSTRILDLRDRVFAATIYPLYIVATGLVVLTGLLIDVVPRFEEVFREFGGSLPAPTRFLVNLSHLLREHGQYILLGLIVLCAVFVFARARIRRGDTLRSYLDKLRERVPVIGRSFRTITIARFSKALGLLLEARVPIEESLDLASAAAGNDYLRQRVRDATRHIAQGEKIAEAFLDTKYFPHSYLWFLANGERREQLPKTLIDLSESYERDVSARDRALLNLIAPVSVVVLGAFVAFMVIAMYLPIFVLGDAISGG